VVADEELAEKVARYDTDGLSDRQRAALRYADAHMTGPAGMNRGLPTELNRCFTSRQIVELTLDVVAWNRQKVLVALDTDRPADAHNLSALTFDAQGHHRAGGVI